MAKLIIKANKQRALRLKAHLEKEHPSTKGKMTVRK